MLFLETFAKPLLVLHAVATVGLLGSATHLGVLSGRRLLGGSPRVRLRSTFAMVTLTTFVTTHLLGPLLYPAFRIRVRAAYLDHTMPLATSLFEVKEHWAAIGLAL